MDTAWIKVFMQSASSYNNEIAYLLSCVVSDDSKTANLLQYVATYYSKDVNLSNDNTSILKNNPAFIAILAVLKASMRGITHYTIDIEQE